jgi:AcrR family transcriptional regulator
VCSSDLTRAAEVLEREGLGISAERLATALGIKRPTLLYYLPTHAHVIETALVALMTEQAVEVMAAIEAHAHPIDRLYAQMRAVHAFHAGREHRIVFLTQAIATIGGARGQEIVQRGVEVFAAQRKEAAARVREGIAKGEVVPCDADALVATMRALTDGLMVQRVTDGLALGGAHELVWSRLLSPLKRTPTPDASRKRGADATKRSDEKSQRSVESKRSDEKSKRSDEKRSATKTRTKSGSAKDDSGKKTASRRAR